MNGHRYRAANDDLGFTARTACVKCRVPFSSTDHSAARCAVCRNNLRAQPDWASPFAGPAFGQPPAASPAIDDRRIGPVPMPSASSASWGAVENLVVAIGLTLVCCIVITLLG